MLKSFPLGSPADSAEPEPPHSGHSASSAPVIDAPSIERHSSGPREAGLASNGGAAWLWWRACLRARLNEMSELAHRGCRTSASAQAASAQAASGARRIAALPAIPLASAASAARAGGWGQVESPVEAREAELIVALFRTLVLLSVLIGPRLLGVPVTYQIGEIWLAAVAGIYNIVTALGSLLPTRYGLRRPFIVAMDLLLITLWIQLSGQWELRPFYVVVVVVAALWFRVFGGVLTAAFCNFFFLFIWFRAQADPDFAQPHLVSGTLAIHIAMLFLVGCLVGSIAEAQERERERRLEDQLLIANYQREIDLSAQLQPSLIASHWLEEGAQAPGAQVVGQLLPAEAALEIGAAMQSARSLGGGDYFDLIPLGEGRTGICIADVSGKSVRAQARLPLLKYSLRALAPLYTQPEKLVERLNATLSPDLQPELYIAFCYIVLDPRAQVLAWCNAGHIAPLLLQNCGAAGGLEITRLKTHGPALGMFPDAQYASPSARREMAWQQGDELLLYTDGLTDALSYRNSEDGEAQLKKLATRLCEQKDRPARELAREMVSLATAILDSASPLQRAQGVLNQISEGGRHEGEAEAGRHRDDITLVLARFV